jgi:hypothetical protein
MIFVRKTGTSNGPFFLIRMMTGQKWQNSLSAFTSRVSISMLIPVKNLRSICDPFSQSPWEGYSISHTLIQYCIDNNLLLPEPYDEATLDHYTKGEEWGEANGHVARVA